MKLSLLMLIVPIVAFSGAGFSWHDLAPSTYQRWFDSYGNVPWDEEKAHLDNFAVALKQDQQLIGYIIVYAGRRACVNEARNRGLRAKNYLVKNFGLAQHRVKWIDGGYQEEVTVILQPAPVDAPEPEPSPTLKASEVRRIRNCRYQPPKSKE